MELGTSVLDELRHAKRLLDQTSLAARIANAVGTPVEKILDALPDGASKMILAATNKSLTAALDFAISTLPTRHARSSDAIHKWLVVATGAAGGAFGLPALAIELPASTMLMLRSIGDIANAAGEPMESPETRLACIQVFALGGPKPQDDAVESGYFAIRAVLASAMTEASEYIARHGVARAGAPPLVRLTTQIAARFGIPVSEKVVAQALPVIGAAGGALINLLFIDHFQKLAHGHFTVRRFERTYGSEAVRQAYLRL